MSSRCRLTDPVRINGWALYEHPAFVRQRAKLMAAVTKMKADDPDGWERSDAAKLLASVTHLTAQVIPADPANPKFRQGGTLGPRRKHWFRAKFGNGRYRLFFQFSSAGKTIIYAWLNDADTLRTYGDYDDAYATFGRMLDAGDPPDTWTELIAAAGGDRSPEPVTKPRKRKRRGG